MVDSIKALKNSGELGRDAKLLYHQLFSVIKNFLLSKWAPLAILGMPLGKIGKNHFISQPKMPMNIVWPPEIQSAVPIRHFRRRAKRDCMMHGEG
jgi:hypothetical protein